MVSNSAKQKLLRMETQAKFPYLIRITTPDGEVFRYANSSEDIVYNDETYDGAYFQISPPERTEDGIKDAKITISSVDQEWITRIRNTSGRSKIEFVAVIQYYENEETYIEALDEIDFILTNASWNETTIQWTMKFDEGLEYLMPCHILNQFIAPALY